METKTLLSSLVIGCALASLQCGGGLSTGPGGPAPLPAWTGSRQLGASGVDTIAYGVAVDSESNVYLSGQTAGALPGSSHAGTSNMFLIRFDPGGLQQWIRQLGSNLTQVKVGASALGHVYAGGQTTVGVDGNAQVSAGSGFVTQYDRLGHRQWTRQISVSSGPAGIGISNVAAGTSGEVYAVGTTSGPIDGIPVVGAEDFFLVRYGVSGSKDWVRLQGVSSGGSTIYSASVAVDSSNGAIYVGGFTNGSLNGEPEHGTRDAYIIRYDASGERLWTRLKGASGAEVFVSDLAAGGGRVCFTGYSTVGLDGYTVHGASDAFVSCHDSDGNWQWTRMLQPSAAFASGQAIALDGAGRVYVSGYTEGALEGNTQTGTRDLFVAQYDSAGTLLAFRQFGSSGDTFIPNAAAVDFNAGSRIFFAGETNGGLDGFTPTGTKDFFLILMGSDGVRR
jgi:hypothetical protein